jgi:hypothetical protein
VCSQNWVRCHKPLLLHHLVVGRVDRFDLLDLIEVVSDPAQEKVDFTVSVIVLEYDLDQRAALGDFFSE